MVRIRGLMLVVLVVMGVCAAGAQAGASAGGPVVVKAGRVVADSELGRTIVGLLAGRGVARAHWGIDVVGLDGTPIYSMNEGQFFQPASNAKLFTTAAALALLGGDRTFETRVVAKGVLDDAGRLKGDLYLVGDGDANLSGREIPYVSPPLRPKVVPGAPPVPEVDPLRYLAEMADQVVKSGIKVVDGNVFGDDTLFPWEPYAQNWSIDDMVWGYGAPVSALTINDNQIKVTVTPGATEGALATVTFDPPVPFYTVGGGVVQTSKAKSATAIDISRDPGSMNLRINGSIAVGSPPDVEEVAISNPPTFAATALKQILESKGIVVLGHAGNRSLNDGERPGFLAESHEPIADLSYGNYDGDRQQAQFCFTVAQCPSTDEKVVASHRSPRLADDVVVTNKVSQNLHAELLLRQLGVAYGKDGSFAQGARVVRAFLTTKVGIDKDDFVFYDGSGLSGHDLVTPRATVRLLQYAQAQPWFADWRKSLPVGGVDGSLEGRFAKAPLAGHVFAKTGTLGEARALSGYLDCASGRTVIFSIMVGNHAPGSNADRDVMDKVVAAIAANN